MKGKIPSWSSVTATLVSMRKTIPRAIRLMFRYAPGWTVAGIVLVIILGLLPLATLYIMKLLVDTVTSGIMAPDKDLVIHELTILLIAAAFLSLLTTSGRGFSSYISEVQSIIMTDRISDLIHEQSLNLDLAYYENATYHNTLHRAQMGGMSRPGKVISDMVQIGQNCISIGAVGTLILSFSPMAGLVLIGAALPAAGLKVWYSQKSYDLTLSQTEMERRSSYYHQVLTFLPFAKELRIFSSGSFFRKRYRDVRLSLRYARLALSRSRVVWDTITQGLVTFAVFGSFMVIVFMTVRGETSLGDMVVFLTGFQMCTTYIQSIFGSLNAVYEDHLFLTNLFEFFDLNPLVTVPKDPVPLPSPIKEGIVLSGISFSYPGTGRQVLSDISIQVQKGRITAFVGENGAGKSSLIKLICRLYLPEKGTIMVDGVSLDQADPGEWRRKISVMFQDYIHYHLNARENIWIADIGKDPEDTSVETAARKSGADKVIEDLPEGYDTILGRYFTNGQELSTGQWQKIALSRTFFRDAEVVILDEPASSLDALAEAEIFTRFKEIVSGKTAILISHRFSTVMMADYIYLLKDGGIAEEGTHCQLLEQNGLYAKMYHAQADLYE